MLLLFLAVFGAGEGGQKTCRVDKVWVLISLSCESVPKAPKKGNLEKIDHEQQKVDSLLPLESFRGFVLFFSLSLLLSLSSYLLFPRPILGKANYRYVSKQR